MGQASGLNIVRQQSADYLRLNRRFQGLEKRADRNVRPTVRFPGVGNPGNKGADLEKSEKPQKNIRTDSCILYYHRHFRVFYARFSSVSFATPYCQSLRVSHCLRRSTATKQGPF
jgi:hypothetical protein